MTDDTATDERAGSDGEGLTDDDFDAEGEDGRSSAETRAASLQETSDRADLEAEIERLREEVAAFEEDIQERTVHRDDVEGDLKRYVRKRVRRGHARGWGPYLVLLYGTAMTIGAFFAPNLSNLWAILAMIVIWLSTLGLYALMVLVGAGLSLLEAPGRIRDAVGAWRS